MASRIGAFRAAANPVAEKLGVDPLVIAGIFALLAQVIQRCLPDPANAAAWLRQDTPATRRVVRKTVRQECAVRGMDRRASDDLAREVVEAARDIQTPQVRAFYAELKRAK